MAFHGSCRASAMRALPALWTNAAKVPTPTILHWHGRSNCTALGRVHAMLGMRVHAFCTRPCMCHSTAGMQYGAYSVAQRAELRPMVADFLSAPTSTPYDALEPLGQTLTSLRHMREVLYMARVSAYARPAWVGTQPDAAWSGTA